MGVELGGTLKNIVAIGAGLIDGIGLGNNAKSAFISRAIAEISRLGMAAGAELITFAGLACLGDVLATCYSQLSRNRFVGEQLGKGKQIDEILETLGQVAEGVDTTHAALILAKNLGIEMPITEQTSKVLRGEIGAEDALENLMSRTPRSEDPFRTSQE
jgi:glycerol-3-phosphate dehydrogenase (NAD(P)+)